MRFEVTVLGNNSAFAAHGRFPSAQVVNHNDSLFLIDCGEGTQFQFSTHHVRWTRIDHIFISHLHGDHIFGLPGLINSFAQQQRKTPLRIFGPKGIRQMIQTILRLSGSQLTYDLEWFEIDHAGKILLLETRTIKIYSFPVKHRIPTYGFLFREKHLLLNIDPEAIKTHNLTYDQIRSIKSGADLILDNGIVIPNADLTLNPKPSRSYAYCGDTIYDPDIIQYIREVDLLYHEATFLHELVRKAEVSMHTTALQAGKIASEANAHQLLIGHYSSRYEDLQPLLEEALLTFDHVQLSIGGETYEVMAREN